MNTSNRKNIFISLVIFIFLLIFIDLILPKIGLSIDSSYKSKPFPIQQSNYLPFTLKENITIRHIQSEYNILYHTDKNGYRSNRGQLTELFNNNSVLFIGDSFTLGYGVNYKDSFVGIIQNKSNYNTINAAYKAGYSPDSYYAYLQNEGFKLRPKKIIINIYAGNDIIDDMQNNIWIEKDKKQLPTKIRTFRNYTGFNGLYIKPHYNNSNPFMKSNLIKTFYNRVYYERLASKKSKASSWIDFLSIIKEINRLAIINNTEVVFLITPYSLNRPLSEKNHTYYEKTIQLLKENNISNFIELKKHLSSLDFYEKDGHLNKEGNRKVANIILKKILKNKSRTH